MFHLQASPLLQELDELPPQFWRPPSTVVTAELICQNPAVWTSPEDATDHSISISTGGPSETLMWRERPVRGRTANCEPLRRGIVDELRDLLAAVVWVWSGVVVLDGPD